MFKSCETCGILQIEVNMAFLEISYNHLIFRAQAHTDMFIISRDRNPLVVKEVQAILDSAIYDGAIQLANLNINQALHGIPSSPIPILSSVPSEPIGKQL